MILLFRDMSQAAEDSHLFDVKTVDETIVPEDRIYFDKRKLSEKI